MRYHRQTISGGCYFFTVVTYHRRQLFDNDATVDILRRAFREVRSRHPFTIDAIVVLPNHLHTLWTLPEGDSDFPTRWMLIKSRFTREFAKGRPDPVSDSRARRRERSVWQRRYWEHLIRDPRDFAAHFDYIHYNPVKHGYTKAAADWPWSSIHHHIQAGALPPNWGVAQPPNFPDSVGHE